MTKEHARNLVGIVAIVVLSCVAISCAAAVTTVDLDMDVVSQTTGYTCSAASSLTLLEYFKCANFNYGTMEKDLYYYRNIMGSNNYVYQVTNKLNENIKPKLPTVSYQWSILTNNYSKYIETIQTSLDNGCPVIARIAIPSNEQYFGYYSSGHYVVISGIYEKSGITMLSVLDPNQARTGGTIGKIPIRAEVLYSYGMRKEDVYLIHRSSGTYVSFTWTNAVKLSAIYKTTKDDVPLRFKPEASGEIQKRLTKGSNLYVVEKGYNSANNLWYKVIYNNVTYYVYSENVRYIREEFQYTITNLRFPSGPLPLGKSYAISGDIVATHNISSLYVTVVRLPYVNESVSVVMKSTIRPNAKTASISGTINDAIMFRKLPLGNYKYRIDMDIDALDICVPIKICEFSIVAPVAVTGVTANKSSMVLGDTVEWSIGTSGGYGTISYRFQVFCAGKLVDDTGYVTYNKLQYTPREAGNYDVLVFAKDNTTESSKRSAILTVLSSTIVNEHAGDANNDGKTDIKDLASLIDCIIFGTSPGSFENADVNDDNEVNIVDLVLIIDIIVHPPARELNKADSAADAISTVEIPFSSNSPITVLQVDYALSSGLRFLDAECASMTGAGGETRAVFVNMNGVTSGVVTLRVQRLGDAAQNQTVKVLAVTGASAKETLAAGTAAEYQIRTNTDQALAILSQPANTTVVEGTKATFAVDATGAEPLAYQWYINRNDGRGWVQPKDASSSTYYSSPVTMANDGYQYYCRISDAGGGQIQSRTATLNVIKAPRTGDASHPLYMLLVAAAAMAALAIIAKNRRRAKR